MPIHEFTCRSCDHDYEEFFHRHDPTGEYAGTRCPVCSSLEKKKKVSRVSFAFADPTTTSKFDNFEYRAGYNLDKAKGIRRRGEQTNHMGPDVHPHIDDINDPSKGDLFGPVQ